MILILSHKLGFHVAKRLQLCLELLILCHDALQLGLHFVGIESKKAYTYLACC